MFSVIEPLETRVLLSWPNAPFNGNGPVPTLYANQDGAVVLHQRWPASHNGYNGFNGYRIRFDDPGSLTFKTQGRVPTQLAYYSRSGPPKSQTSAKLAAGNGTLRVKTPAKQWLYLGVQAKTPNPGGTYVLRVKGEPYGVILNMPVSAKTNAYSRIGDVEHPGDIDFFQFTTTATGTWRIRITPVKGKTADVSLNVFDRWGRPVGGSFTQPINEGGRGQREQWVGTNLPKGSHLYLRIDGQGESSGLYAIGVRMVREGLTRPHRK